MSVHRTEKIDNEWGGDSKEEIDKCLHCPYVECLDCLTGINAKALARFIDPPSPRLWSATGDTRKVIDLYLEGYYLKDIAEILNMSLTKVNRIRRDAALSPVPLETREERKEFLEKWLEKFGVLSMVRQRQTPAPIAENTGSP